MQPSPSSFGWTPFLTLSACYLSYIWLKKEPSKHRHTPTHGLIIFTSTGSGGDSNGSGISLTWCQGLNFCGISFEETAAPKGLLHLCVSSPTFQPLHAIPTLIHWHFKFHSMNSFVKFIHPPSPFIEEKEKKESFSGKAVVVLYLGRAVQTAAVYKKYTGLRSDLLSSDAFFPV